MVLLRIRSPNGQSRITVSDTDEVSVAEVLSLDPHSFVVSKDPSGASRLPTSSVKVKDLNLTHGHLLFVTYSTVSPSVGANAANSTAVSSSASLGSATLTALNSSSTQIDDFLEKQNGLIKRAFDKTFCRHGPSGMCDYCMPLEPYDPKYLEENKIKHMSFHSHLRKIINQNKTPAFGHSQFIPPLDELSLAVKVPCPSKTHDSWPNGICTKCQPSALSLQSQTFRMVDHVEFESAAVIDAFIGFWRNTGQQRFGYLFGRYESYSEVPLGVKAVVAAIYEPPQIGSFDGIQMLSDPRDEDVDQVAEKLGMTRVGMIYTDLIDDGTGTGAVVCKRHSQSYFLSSAEIMFVAHKQRNRPTPCKYSSTGTYGSRFVTCVISGNTEGNIDISAFQISNTGVALVRDAIVEATVEPGLLRVKESSKNLYVPEIFYKYKNEYGIEVSEAARPTFPVDYLLVTLSHGFPQTPKPTFTAPLFQPENRETLGVTHDFALLKQYLASSAGNLSDFHLLLYLRTVSILEPNDFDVLLRNVAGLDVAEVLATNAAWNTLVGIVSEATSPVAVGGMYGGGSSSSSGITAKGSGDAPWECTHCTFLNIHGTECEMCGLPKN